jgi:DNA-directed RNA polymerase specialized sigma24 family protein
MERDVLAIERQTDAEIVSALYPDLRRFAAVVAPWDFDPDDVLHGVLVNVLGKRPLDLVDDPSAYLRRSIVNRVKSELRKVRTRRMTIDLLKRAVAPVGAVTYPSDLSDLMRLQPIERAVLYLHDVDGMPFAEVAEAVGITAGNARVTASRARQKLKDLFSEEDHR